MSVIKALFGLFMVFFCAALGAIGLTILFIIAMLWVGRMVNRWQKTGEHYRGEKI